MCDPVTLAAASFTLASVSAVAQYQQGKAVAKAQTAAYNRNIVNAFASARNEQRQITLREIQEAENTAFKNKMSQLDEAEAKAETIAQASAANVAGPSIDILVEDLGNRSALIRETNRREYAGIALQLREEQTATIDRAKARVEQMSPGVSPSPLVPILQIAQAGVSYGRDMNDIKAGKTGKAKGG